MPPAGSSPPTSPSTGSPSARPSTAPSTNSSPQPASAGTARPTSGWPTTPGCSSRAMREPPTWSWKRQAAASTRRNSPTPIPATCTAATICGTSASSSSAKAPRTSGTKLQHPQMAGSQPMGRSPSDRGRGLADWGPSPGQLAAPLARPGGVRVGGQDPIELAAGADAELGKDAPEVVLGGAGADEQPGADLGVGQPVPRQPGDLGLLGGQHRLGCRGAGGRCGTLAGGLAGCQQLAAGPIGECRHAHLLQHLVGGAQLLPRVHAAALPAQPFPVQQAGAGQFGADPGPA